MANVAVRADRAQRRRERDERLWQILTNPAVLEPLGISATMIGTYLAGRSRILNRDIAGMLFALQGVLAAARYGVNDRYALLGIWGALASTYSLTVPPTEGEALVELQPLGGEDWSGGAWEDTKNLLLGSDKKFFGWEVP